jgi:peptidoglycan/LPS O-acetylase OafA/YrhL
VDLFFLLSGFVIAHAYNGRLGGGMTLLTFVRIRLIRLFPVYLIGTGLGLAYFLLRMRLEPGKPIGLVYLGRETLLSVLMLPQIGKATLPGLYPFDPAAWSLFLEVLANIAYAAVFRLITTRRLMIFVAASGVLLAWISWPHGSLDIGMSTETILGGAVRCGFGFSLGTLLYRLRPKRQIAPPEVGLYLALLVFATHPTPSLRWGYDLAAAFLVFPILMMISTHTKVGRRQAAFEFGALLSYPIYLLHTPLLLIGLGIYKALTHADPAGAVPFAGLAVIAVVFVASYVTASWIDLPVRRFLTALAARRRGRSPAAAPVA